MTNHNRRPFQTTHVKVPLKCNVCKKKDVYRIHAEDLETKGYKKCYFCGATIFIVEKKGMILGKKERKGGPSSSYA